MLNRSYGQHQARFHSTINENVPDVDHNSYLPDFNPPIFDIVETNIDMVEKAIDMLSSTSSSYYDGITSYLLKCSKPCLSGILVHIFNLSIRNKVFPALWKEAKITPLYKIGDHDNPTNYRPISILPTVGKVLERTIHDQLYNYLTINNLLTPRQSGFRKGYSTGTCIIDLLHNIYETVDGGGACGVLFLDLSKAFDTVDHSIVRTKLKAFGIKESSISWFLSYLSNRVQCTSVDGVLSNLEHTGSGVPQGSILGPLLLCAT